MKKPEKVRLWMLIMQASVLRGQSRLLWSRQKRRIKMEDRHLKRSEQSCS